MTPPTLPGIVTLYERDATLRKAVNTAAFAILAVAGFNWFAPASAHPTPTVDLSFEVEMVKWVTVGGAILATLAALTAAWRYMLVTNILANGTTVRGLVEDIEVYSWRTDKPSPTTVKPTYDYSYYARLRYEVRGLERKARVKLPNSGVTFGLAKGQETELIVLDSKPNTPLIRSVYFKVFH